MRNLFSEIVTLTRSKEVELGQEMQNLLDTELTLGMTRYQCKWGTLSDGHEHVTKAGRYYQSVRELWLRSNHMIQLEAKATKLKIRLGFWNLLHKLSKITMMPFVIDWIGADVKLAENALLDALVAARELHKQMDEFNKVRLELQNEVRKKYPMGIEQAQPDIYKELARYRAKKRKLGYQNEQLTHVPLDPMSKAEVGVEVGAPDLFLFLEHQEPEMLSAAGGSPQILVELQKSHTLALEKERKKRVSRLVIDNSKEAPSN